MVFAVRSVAEAGENVLLGEIRKVSEDFLMRHPRSKLGQYVINGDAHPPNAGFSTALAGLDGDELVIVHTRIISSKL